MVEARAAQYADVPGGDTGMLVCQIKLVRVAGVSDGGTGGRRDGGRARERAVEIAEYAVDVGLLKELREHEKQASQELGQWDGDRQDELAVLVREYVGVAVDQV